MKLHVLVPLAFLASLALPAAADHASWHCAPPEYVEAGGFYVIYAPDPALYQEANGIPGPQRGGASPYVPDDASRCIDDPAYGPDLLVL